MGDRRSSANGQQRAKPNSARMQHRANKVRGTVRRPIHDICVYCGSNPGRNPAYAEAARTLGRRMAESGIGLVYGGGGLGLMGEIARSVLTHGGRVTGIIPEFLSEREHMLRDVTELVVVGDMHQRKKLMFDKSDAFVALPGGIGTLEELVEQLTWAQLGRHSKPIVLMNTEGFWTPFIGLLEHMKREVFIRDGMDVHFVAVDGPEAVLDAVFAGAGRERAPAEAAIAEKF